MIAIDTNILVYAHRSELPQHRASRAAVTACAEGRARWAIPWPCIHEFLAIVTHARVFKPPTPIERAVAQVRAWLESPSVALLGEDGEYFEGLAELLLDTATTGPKIHDARIAALCRQHGVTELWTADRDFSRFASLRTRNPAA